MRISCRKWNGKEWQSSTKTPNLQQLATKLDTVLNRLHEHSLSIGVLKSKLTEINTQENDVFSYGKTVSNSPTSNMHRPSKRENTKLTTTTSTKQLQPKRYCN